MKKNWLYLFICCMLVGSLVSCSEEDDLDDYPTIGNENNGVYMGNLTYGIGSADPTPLPQKVYVKKSKDEHVDIQINNLHWKEGRLSVTLEDIKASIEEFGGIVTLSSQQTVSVGTEEAKELEFEITLNGTIDKEQLDAEGTIHFLIPSDLGEKKFVFKGTKLEGDLSSEANITEFGIESNLIIGEGSRLYTDTREIKLALSKEATTEDLKHLKPIFEVSEGAKVSPASGTPLDFTNPVIFTVTSQDGIVTNVYKVTFFDRLSVINFEDWENKNTHLDPACQYTLPLGQNRLMWSSSDAAFANLMNNPTTSEDESVPIKPADHFGVTAVSDAHSGSHAASLQTMRMRESNIYGVPAIVGGMLYSGTHEFDFNNFPYLGNIKMGFPVNYKPIALKGYYKYKSGTPYSLCLDISNPTNVIERNDTEDALLIRVVVFQVDNRFNEEEVLSLADIAKTDINQISDKVVAIGEFKSSAHQTSYQEFSIPIEFNADKEFSYSKEYRIAFYITSSYKSHLFSGANGSTLLLDDLEIISE